MNEHNIIWTWAFVDLIYFVVGAGLLYATFFVDGIMYWTCILLSAVFFFQALRLLWNLFVSIVTAFVIVNIEEGEYDINIEKATHLYIHTDFEDDEFFDLLEEEIENLVCEDEDESKDEEV